MSYQPPRVRLRTFSGQEYGPDDDRLAIECFRCGICCIGYHPRLSVEEVEHMAGHLSLSTDEFISRYVQVTQVGYLLRQTEYGCIFLDWEKSGSKALCSIHRFRPEVCRNWVPGLLRRECLAGLAKIQKNGGLLLASDIYENEEQLERFYDSLRNKDESHRPKYLGRLPGQSF